MKNQSICGGTSLETTSPNMAERNIYLRQNSRRILLLFKAQSHNYSKAKDCIRLGFFASLVSFILSAILVFYYEMSIAFSIFLSLSVFAANSYLINKSNKYIELAAKIQQTIDIDLFKFSSNFNTLTFSEITEVSAPYKNKNLSRFENWYSDYSNNDFLKQIFYCQKENIRWEKRLRTKYLTLLFTIIIVLPIVSLAYLLSIGADISHYMMACSWLFPIEQLLITQYVRHRDNIELLIEINSEWKCLEKYFSKHNEDELTCKLCALQSLIFEYRKRSVLVPNLFYFMFKKSMQKYEDDIASETTGQNS